MPDRQIGIIVPSFRDARIVHTIISIIMLDPSNLTRIYIMDGGSPDELLNAIRGLLRPHDILVSERDAGIFDALNKGLDILAEPYFGWLGSDDFYTGSVKFAEMVERFEKEQLDCVIFGTAFIDDFKVRRRTPAYRPSSFNYLIGRLVPHFSSFWRKETIGSRRFDLNFPSSSDQDFFLGLILTKPPRSYCSPTVGTMMRLGGASTGGARRILRANLDTFKIYRHHRGMLLGLLGVGSKVASKLIPSTFARPLPVMGDMTDAITAAGQLAMSNSRTSRLKGGRTPGTQSRAPNS